MSQTAALPVAARLAACGCAVLLLLLCWHVCKASTTAAAAVLL
jgi:hypothetical protein